MIEKMAAIVGNISSNVPAIRVPEKPSPQLPHSRTTVSMVLRMELLVPKYVLRGYSALLITAWIALV